jgi:multimeric flavodoxin WrbA
MNALILDGSRDGDDLTPVAVSGISSALPARGAVIERVPLRERDIAPCAGCFGCWTKTPGDCVIADDARDILRSYVRSDLVVCATPVTFGGYSSQLKKMIDRLIPVLDPRFVVVGGEVHHRLRYRRYPRTVVLGTLPAPDPDAQRLFSRLAAQRSLNPGGTPVSTVLIGVTDPIAARRSAEFLLDRSEAPA